MSATAPPPRAPRFTLQRRRGSTGPGDLSVASLRHPGCPLYNPTLPALHPTTQHNNASPYRRHPHPPKGTFDLLVYTDSASAVPEEWCAAPPSPPRPLRLTLPPPYFPLALRPACGGPLAFASPRCCPDLDRRTNVQRLINAQITPPPSLITVINQPPHQSPLPPQHPGRSPTRATSRRRATSSCARSRRACTASTRRSRTASPTLRRERWRRVLWRMAAAAAADDGGGILAAATPEVVA